MYLKWFESGTPSALEILKEPNSEREYEGPERVY
jgi:hypothetical protein